MARRTVVLAAAVVMVAAALLGSTQAQAATAAASPARLTPGTVSLTAAEVTSIAPGRLTLVKDQRTRALRDGSVVGVAHA